MTIYSDLCHRRYNILTGDWVLVSPHRSKRPWQGKTEAQSNVVRPAYDEHCYLCPGNTRASGQSNPAYTGTYVFNNDFAALQSEAPQESIEDGLFKAVGERGVCRVLCFSPDHSKTLPDLSIDNIIDIIHLWQNEYNTLGNLPYVNHVQIFENKGAIMGCSNPHPHGQIWAQSSIPDVIRKKTANQKEHYQKTGNSLLSDYLFQELSVGERIVCQNESFVALVPFWAVWPFETIIIPRRHMQHIGQLSSTEEAHFAMILKQLTQCYDKLFDTSFPYSCGIHQSPTDGQEHPEWHFHMAFYPPLLRSASVKKFMVGYEMLAEPQRDITAEMAASQLKAYCE